MKLKLSFGKKINFQSTGVTLSSLPTMYLCKFGLNPLTGSERFIINSLYL